MPWINIEKIPTAEFRRGYKPPEYHDIIIASRDSKFMFPRVIEPINFNLHDKAELISFFNDNKATFDFKRDITSITRYSFMPGPGEIRPTHVVLRYNLYNQEAIQKQVILKIIHSFGFQEYDRQLKFYTAGYPTPKPFLFFNYFTDLELLLKRKNESLHDLDLAAIIDFLKDIELRKKSFSEYYSASNKQKTTNMLNWLKGISTGDEIALLDRYNEDLESIDDGFFDGLEFNGFFFMEYIEKTLSFEQMLFDSLGGRKLEESSGAMENFPFRPEYDPGFIMQQVIDLILRLWNMGECHNDMKGEHFLYDFKNKRWNVIDWGELVSAGVGQDLAVFLADNTAFIQDRCKYNILYGKKKGANIKQLKRMEHSILEQNSVFWDIFLDKICTKISASAIRDAYHILSNRNLTFQADKLKRYF
ncbi:MAG TPA: phosphotransferase [Candidatus Lokiarchaeia archaeon]|nr:phosphotransferase [Candidatus Lokiarchaeia archaeon]